MNPTSFEVFAFLRQFLDLQPRHGVLPELQHAVLGKFHRFLEREGHWPITDFVLGLHQGVGGESRTGLIVGAVCALFYAFADVIDDAEDHDLSDVPWSEAGWEQAVNTGNSLLFLCLRVAMEYLPAEVGHQVAGAVIRGGDRMTRGQHLDLATCEHGQGTEDWEAMVRGKSGGSFGAYAEAVAVANGRDLEAFRALGESLGIFLQALNDTHEFFGERLSPDLVNGRLTFPLALAVDHLGAEELAPFWPERGRPVDWALQVRGVQWFESRGLKGYVALRVEVYRRNATERAQALGVAEVPYLARLLALPAFPQASVAI